MIPFSAVLFDRDGTLVEDVPYNGDPDRVRLLPGAEAAVALARSHGLATGVISNQSGIGRGLLTADDVHRVNERADALLGGLDTWVFCPHAPDAGCACRKPRPGLILTAAARLGVPPAACLVIGDIAADVLAARAAGAHGILVPNEATAPAEAARFAHRTAPDPLTAVRRALGGTGRRIPPGGATNPDQNCSSPLDMPGPAGMRPSWQEAVRDRAWSPAPDAGDAAEVRPSWREAVGDRAWSPAPDAGDPAGMRPSRQDPAAPGRAWPSRLDAVVRGRAWSSEGDLADRWPAWVAQGHLAGPRPGRRRST
ncbi:HAD-IIIA family hydrolase [Streptomyces sp. CA-142005]|uniref:D-glycero-alpha-D-manno-heptose-1,7-bisphosphate 7-phosphatase n=1 Tax=Streptomyces sp. CA-142005 TaxID=3240052 RepID=UPI003D8CC7E5